MRLTAHAIRLLALPAFAIVGLGVAVVAIAGWGGLWPFLLYVGLVVCVVILMAYGGPAIEEIGRAHNLSALSERTRRSR